jgi:hypothetical protein
MADTEDGARRANLLGDLEILNMELARMRVAPIISDAAASLYPVDDLPALIAATRRHLRKTAADLGGL